MAVAVEQPPRRWWFRRSGEFREQAAAGGFAAFLRGEHAPIR